MNYIISANSDIGTTRPENQDCVMVKVIQTCVGKSAFAVLCDGMGGLSCGEVASASVVRAFEKWAETELPKLCRDTLTDSIISASWEHLIEEQRKVIESYGVQNQVELGTTAVAILVTPSRYYVLNVGDSRVYELTDETVRQITEDQTVVNRELRMGILTQEEAENDPRNHILWQCVGASGRVYPEMFFGDTQADALYLLCSDGFYHKTTAEEFHQKLKPSELYDYSSMTERGRELIEQNKLRQERDNITVAMIRTYE